MQEEARLGEIIRADPHLTAALEAARDIAAPDWLVCAGAIRDAVWDVLHGRAPVPPRDVDVSFFDPGNLTPACDEAVTVALFEREPALRWDAANQAAVHLWYPKRFGIAVEAFASSADAIATFPETASCVGVRLLHDGALLVVAPYGLGDLLGGVCRHNPARAPEEVYRRRVEEKGWRERWPLLRFS
jgi:hypothetical protein